MWQVQPKKQIASTYVDSSAAHHGAPSAQKTMREQTGNRIAFDSA